MRTFLFHSILTLSLSGCAVLHHVQVGDVDSRQNYAWIPFDVMVSETGVSAEEIGKLARATETQAGRDAGGIADAVAMFQIGPRTGKPVYNERYAERLIYLIHEKCPSGRVTGLMSVREMKNYPAISGEIVKVTGYCLRPRPAAAPQKG